MALDPKVRAFLEDPRYAVLATVNRDGSPHLTEMWYGIRDGEVFFNTTEERVKRRNLERDTRVSLLVASKEGEPTWRTHAYVRIDGRARRVATGERALDDIVALGVRYDGPENAAKARATFAGQNRVTYVIDVQRVLRNEL